MDRPCCSMRAARSARVTEAAEATSHFDVGEEVVSPYLWSRRVRRLDVLVLSHAHSDHMGGMPAVMRNFRPRELWVSVDPNSDAYRALIAEAKDYGVTVRHFHAGDQLTWGGTQVTVLAPEIGYTNPREPVNNDSLVMRMQYGKSSVLLEGDAEAPSEREMLAHGQGRFCDAAEGRTSRQPHLDDASFSRCRCSKRRSRIRGQGEYIWAPPIRSDRADRRSSI